MVAHMKRKSHTLKKFKLFKAYAENHFGLKIKVLQEDEGGEYMSTEFDDYLTSEGIVRRHLTRNRPQQNVVIAPQMNTLRQCFMKPTSLLHSKDWL